MKTFNASFGKDKTPTTITLDAEKNTITLTTGETVRQHASGSILIASGENKDKSVQFASDADKHAVIAILNARQGARQPRIANGAKVSRKAKVYDFETLLDEKDFTRLTTAKESLVKIELEYTKIKDLYLSIEKECINKVNIVLDNKTKEIKINNAIKSLMELGMTEEQARKVVNIK